VGGKTKTTATLPKLKWQALRALFKSIDTLLGNGFGRPASWTDMERHLSFGQKCDYHDIVNIDWPNIRQWFDHALYTETDPIPVVSKDLGELVSAKPRGHVATELRWSILSPKDFERLVFN